MDSIVVIMYFVLGYVITFLALDTAWYFTVCKRQTLTKQLKLAHKKEMDSEKLRRIVLDIKMPDLNGFSLYREIKRLDKKVCFLTAGEIYYHVNQDISSVPVNCFIRKPLDNEELKRRVNEIIVDDTTVWIRSK